MNIFQQRVNLNYINLILYSEYKPQTNNLESTQTLRFRGIVKYSEQII